MNKKTKEFFRPTIVKIIIFLLIPIYIETLTPVICDIAPCPPIPSSEFIPLILVIISIIIINYIHNIQMAITNTLPIFVLVRRDI